ncbi:MAG TPA: DUF4920 domain-containing protein [Balneolaceae bacterium]|nr:DUF4920 domain-containing protein [Balneolaceae bacterium]|tara:strand:- start:201197 stop:201688 length:492 start_codon:yes stop_codon:yes gene_type:complete
MKKVSTLIIALFITISVQAQTEKEVIRLSEPVKTTADYEVFGSDMDLDNIETRSLSQVVELGNEAQSIALKTTVAKVCQKKGCFFIAQDGDVQARITFVDYSFFIPTDSQGKEVILIGDFNIKTLSEDQAKHYAEDAGADADSIEGDQKEYSIIATSVAVPLK